MQSLPLRTGAKLSFEKDGDGWQVSGSELIAESGVASLDEFRILYENDLGFPDFLGRIAQSDWDPSMMDISTPDKAAVNLLYLRGNISVREGIQEDICDVSVTFVDGSEVTITMANQFDEGWLPQDWHEYDGGNNRTAADLARQYARGVLHKSGQYIYPILSAAKAAGLHHPAAHGRERRDQLGIRHFVALLPRFCARTDKRRRIHCRIPDVCRRCG